MTPWASGRRFVIMLVVGSVVAAFLLTVGIATVYQAPSCADNKQNQGERGIDCGGPCEFLCKDDVHSPVVLFTKVLNNGEGRADIVSMVENKNTDAVARNMSYTVTLYGADQTVLREVRGSIDISPKTTVPVFIPGMYSRFDKSMRAFLVIDDASLAWSTARASDLPVTPTVATPRITGTTDAPRVTAEVTNPDTAVLSNIRFVALLYDDEGEIIGASSSVIPSLKPLGSATVRFVWNGAFMNVPAVVTVLPVLPLR